LGTSVGSRREQRDLPTTTDLRSVLAAVVNEHMGIDSNMRANIFPGFQPSGNPFVRA